MGKALYRQHRPKKLAEVIGQEHITDTLSNALKQDKISHAYLFTGPRGVGKTSIARILAHEINDLPYDDDTIHIDIVEIDAASNRRIDEIRDLRDKVHVVPTSAKYKVYIIDEVHMLTREAFNALLKTLEEPPAHVVFILATTDAHKIPETIISRTQRFNFRPVEKAKVVAHLQSIADSEKITISSEALELLAEHGEGSFRDSISLLDQAAGQGSAVTEASVRQQLGIPPDTAIAELLQNLARSAAIATIAQQLEALYNQGYQAVAVASQLAGIVRRELADDQSQLSSDRALQLLGTLLEVPAAFDPERFLEISLLNYGQVSPAVATVAAVQAVQPVKPKPPEPTVETTVTVDNTPEPEPITKPVVETEAAPVVATSDKLPFDAQLWPNILQALKQKYNTLYGVIRMSEPTFTDDRTLKLAFKFAFHQKRVNESSNRKIITDIIESLTGQKVKIDCVFDKQATPAKNAVVTADSLKTVSNIFGGGELLES